MYHGLSVRLLLKQLVGSDCRVSGLRALVTRAAEGTFLIRLLSEHNLGRLTMRSDESIRRALREPLRLRDWVCSASGEATASGFISLLISEHRTSTGGPFLAD